MEEKIKNHVAELLENAPKTKNTIELRQEICTNLLDKYHDLISNGATENEAYTIVINSIGDIDELVKNESEPENYTEQKKKFAIRQSISIALYILSPLPLILLAIIGQPIMGLVFLFVFVAVATAIIVYNNACRPKYEKFDDTIVEEFKEWKDENNTKKARKNSYTSALWSLVVALYIIISFVTGAWHITWVIFLIGAAIERIILINIK